MVIESMAAQGKEPTFCMGDDIPLAVLSRRPHMLYDYFKQRFAQVCNFHEIPWQVKHHSIFDRCGSVRLARLYASDVARNLSLTKSVVMASSISIIKYLLM